MAGMMTELRALSPELRVEAHLIELEAMGYTVVEDAIPPALLARLQANHRQLIQRVRECKPPEEWSMESDKPGVVDAWRLYGMDPAYEELLTLPNVFPIIDRAIREGRGRPAHTGGPRLYHEMAQHMPAGTPAGQSWHRDGDYVRCTFTLNDLGPRDGGTVILPGSHRDDGMAQAYGEILNHQEKVSYAQGGQVGSGFDNTPTQPHAMPTWVSQTGPAGSCLINWTMLWHTRSPSAGTVDRDLIWQIYRRPNQPCGSGRRQHHPTAAWVAKVKRGSNELCASRPSTHSNCRPPNATTVPSRVLRHVSRLLTARCCCCCWWWCWCCCCCWCWCWWCWWCWWCGCLYASGCMHACSEEHRR